MDFFGFILMSIIFFILDYFNIRLCIKINRDLFWDLYKNEIIKECNVIGVNRI